ncbi:MAG: ATP-binding cassette domain-containing protein [Planctomycetes bacterium]|nr:ATP-binding cassette domain-containing protein [Planctomycetota bacterium]
MALLGISNLTHSYGDHIVLDGVNLTLEHGEHVGMVGVNGCGKSTLLKIIAGYGNLKADAGQVQLLRGARAGYLTQDPQLDPNRTLRAEAGAAFAKLHQLHEQMDELTHQMAEAEGDALEALLKKYEQVQHKMEAAGGYAVDHRIDATLHGLGLGDEIFNVKVGALSGGQRGRLALAKLLLTDPDLLLLDEPTNHLDIEARRWLEQYLSSYNGAVIVISHDRWLLDRVASKIYELDRGRLEEYPGNYQKYRVLRRERLEFRWREYEKQQERINREQAFIDRYRAGQRARQASGREKRLERFKRDETVERPITLETMNLRLSSNSRASDVVIVAENISKGYDNKPLFDGLSVSIKRGDCIGIIGPNGAGKTTLINTLLGHLEPDDGKCRVGAQVDVGYYRQTHDHLDLRETVVEYLRRVTSSEQEARGLAGAFLFAGTAQDKPLNVLSGGERSRAVLASLVAGGHNLLVLDEPTNHLDIPSAERLEEALRVYAQPPKSYGTTSEGGGTVMLITHDRMLLDNLVNQLLIFDGQGNVRQFYGTYSEYLATLDPSAAQTPAPPPPKPEPRPERKPDPKPPATKAKGPHSALSDAKLEAKMSTLDQQRTDIDAQLADPNIYRDGQKVRELQQQREKIIDELSSLEEEWLRRSE